MLHLPHFGLPDGSPRTDSWESIRRPSRHSDEALTGTTRAWLRKLPAGRRPQRLCVVYPRLANLIAWNWRDPTLAHEILDELLADRRGGRAGFPRVINFELRRLRDYIDRVPDNEHAGGYLDKLRHFWSGH
jgi:hypothetical protein